MYAVSDEYKLAIGKTDQKTKIQGTITLSNQTIIDIGDESIQQGSLYISSQCIKIDDFSLGSVYASELGLSLTNIDNPYALDNAVISLESGLFTGSEYEWVQLGVFNVIEVQRRMDCVTVKAYCNLILLDEEIETGTSGTVFELLTYCCEKVGLTFGMMQEEIDALPNGDINFTIPSNSEIQTYRDLVSWLAQILGCFATCDRQGELVLKSFAMPAVGNIDGDQRYSTAISDFKVKYAGISMGATTRVRENENGNILTLEENPLLRNQSENLKKIILDNLLDGIVLIDYTPFDIDYTGNPALDLGDFISLTGGAVPAGITGLVTNSNWRYRGKQKLKGVGKDPRIKVKSQADKKIDSNTSETQNVVDVVYYFENAQDKIIGTNDVEIISIYFDTMKEANPIFHATINLVVSAGGTLEFTYLINSSPHRLKPFQTVTAGNHIIHLFLPMPKLKGPLAYELKVMLKSSDVVGVIPKEQIQATINGQGLSTIGANWNGVIQLEDKFEGINFNRISVRFNDVGQAETQTPISQGISVSFVGFTFENKLTFGGLASESFEIGYNKPMPISIYNVGYQQIVIEFDNYLMDYDIIENLEALYVTGTVGGIARQWLQNDVRLDTNNHKLLMLDFDTSQAFDNADGAIRVVYDSVIGTLMGGQKVDGFDMNFNKI